MVPAAVDPMQAQVLAALQALQVSSSLIALSTITDCKLLVPIPDLQKLLLDLLYKSYVWGHYILFWLYDRW